MLLEVLGWEPHLAAPASGRVVEAEAIRDRDEPGSPHRQLGFVATELAQPRLSIGRHPDSPLPSHVLQPLQTTVLGQVPHREAERHVPPFGPEAELPRELIGHQVGLANRGPVPHGLHDLQVRCRRPDEVSVDPAIARRPEEHAGPLRRAPSLDRPASGAPGLLDVVLDRRRHLEVDDELHVLFVDPEPEGLGRDDHIDLAVAERLLHVQPLGALHTPVIRTREVIRPSEQIGQPHRVRAGGHVDDGRPAAEGFHDPHDLDVPIVLVLAILDVVAQFRTIGHPDDPLPLEPQSEQSDDLVRDGGGRGRRHGEDRRTRSLTLRDVPDRLADGCVLRAEGVAPLRDAMRLIHRDPIDPDLAEGRPEPLGPQPLGTHVEELVRAPSRPIEDLLLFPLRHPRVQGGDLGEPPTPQGLQLVTHERDQRGDDERQPLAEERRDLVRDGLTRARRQDGEHVLPTEEPRHDLELPRPPLCEAEALPHLLESSPDPCLVATLLQGEGLQIAPRVGGRQGTDPLPQGLVQIDPEVGGDRPVSLVSALRPQDVWRSRKARQEGLSV
ncbi:hypothetical protein HRbin12_01363 [bacterium HR12]|nr:hypothetical protein HRbin12_01363 [bacterium HR12]